MRPLPVALLGLLALAQASADEAVPLPEFAQAQQRIRAWAAESLQAKTVATPELKRVLARRIEVPAPSVLTAEATEPIRFPLKSPLDFFSPLPDVTIGLRTGEPKITVSGKASGSLLWVSRKLSLTWQLADGEAAWKTQDELKRDWRDWFEKILTDSFEGLPINLEISGGELDEVSGTFNAGGVKMAAGWKPGTDPEGETFLKAEAGPSTPDALKPLASLSLKAEVEASAPVRITDVQYGSPYAKYTVSGRLRDAAVALMTVPFECPHCSGRGKMACDRCANAGAVACEACNATGKEACSSCGASGWFSCPTEQRCSNCGGSGNLRCWHCGGSGTDYESHSETRWYREPYTAGFDSNGQPIVEYQDVPRTHTTRVAVSCGSCGGSGTLGSCGTCGGSGTAACRRCGGSGQRTCGRCSGTGQASCSSCEEGRVRCPVCRGKPDTCWICKGKGGWGGIP